MSEAVDRLGVNVEVVGFSSFENHMRRVNELLTDLATIAPKVGDAGDTIKKALDKIKTALGGSGIAGEANATSMATSAALTKVATAAVETTATVTKAFSEVAKEKKKLEADVKTMAAAAATPDVSVLRGQLQTQIAAARREIETVMREANARMTVLGGNQQADAIFQSLQQRIQVTSDTLDKLVRKRTLIDPSMIEQVDNLSAHVTKMAAQYQKDFDRIGRTQSTALDKSMQSAQRGVEQQLVLMERALSSRSRTSRVDDTGQQAILAQLNKELDAYRTRIDEIRQRGPVSKQSIEEMRQLSVAAADTNRILSDSVTIQNRQATASVNFGNQVDTLRNRLDNLKTTQSAAIKAANLDQGQIAGLLGRLDQEYTQLQSVLTKLDARKGGIATKEDTQSARELGLEITRLNTQINAMVSETAKANRVGLEQRFRKDAASIDNFLQSTERSRQTSVGSSAFLFGEGTDILKQINASAKADRAEYARILAESAEKGAGASLQALRALKQSSIQETQELNNRLYDISVKGAADRRNAARESITPQDFATGVIQKAAESSNELLSKLARGFQYLEESVAKSNTRFNAFYDVIARGRAIVDSYLYPLYLLRDWFAKPVAKTATKGVTELGTAAVKTTGLIGSLMAKIASLSSGALSSIGSGIAGAAGAFKRHKLGPDVDLGAGTAEASRAAEKMAGSIDKANAPARGLLATMKSIVGEIWGINNVSMRVGKSIADNLVSAFKTSFGFNFINIVAGAMNQVQSLIGEAFKAFGDAQATITQFTASISDSLFNSGQFESLAAAEGEAIKQAKELFDWTEKLAILSPFGQDDINRVTRFLQVGGMMGEQMKGLTETIVDAGTGLGLTSDQTVLLGKAFSDVMVKGKLSGQEVLQFANAGVPVMRLLAQATGKTMIELTKFFDSGGILESADAIKLISDYLEGRFSGAAEKAAGTARGLANSITDLRTKLLREFSTPIFEQVVGPALGKMVEALQSEELLGRVRELGQTVADMMDIVARGVGYGFGIFQAAISMINPMILDLIKNIALFLASDIAFAALWSIAVPALLAIGTALGGLISWYGAYTLVSAAFFTAWQHNWHGVRDTVNGVWNYIMAVFRGIQAGTGEVSKAFSTAASIWNAALDAVEAAVNGAVGGIATAFGALASNMIDWGGNIVTALADGIYAAIDSIVEALSYLGEVFAYWLAPGSPPKLLPDLTKWGTGAADAYLEGWTKADFDTLSSISDSITTAFKSIGENVDTNELGKITQAIGNAINQTMATGSFNEGELMAGLDAAVDRFDEISVEVGRMAGAQIRAAVATRQLAAAQDELDAVTQKYDGSLKAVNDEIAQLDRRLNSLDTSSQEEQLTSVINNRFATEKQKLQASLKLQKSAAETKKTSLEDEKTFSTNLLQTKINQLQQEVDKHNEVLGVVSARYKVEFDALAQLTQAHEAVGNAASASTEKAAKSQDRLNDAILAYRLQLADTPGKIAIMREELKKHKEGSVEYYEILTKIAQLEDQWTREKEKGGAKAPLTFKTSPLAEVEQKLEESKAKITTSLDKVKEGIDAAMKDTKQVLDDVKLSWTNLGIAFGAGLGAEGVQGEASLVNRAVYGIGFAVGLVGIVWENFKLGFSGVMPTPDATPVETWANSVGGFIAGIVTKAQEVLGYIKDLGGKIAAAFSAGMSGETTDATGTIVEGSSGGIVQAVARVGEVIRGEFGKLFPEGNPITLTFAGLSAGVQAAIDAIQPAYAALKQTIIDGINAIFGGNGEEGGEGGIVAVVKTQLDLLFGDVTFADMSTSLENLNTAVQEGLKKTPWGDMSPYLGGLVTAIKSGLQSMLSGLEVTVHNMSELITGVQSGDMGGLEMLQNLNASFGGIASAVSGLINSFVTFIIAEIAKIDFAAAGFGIGLLATNLASAVVDTITGIDWFEVMKTVFSATSQFVLGLTGGLVAGLVAIDWNETLTGVFVTLGEAVAGLFAGIFDGVYKVLPGWVQNLLGGNSSIPESPELPKGALEIDEATLKASGFENGKLILPTTASVDEFTVPPEARYELPVIPIIQHLEATEETKQLGTSIADGQVEGYATALTNAENTAKIEQADIGFFSLLKAWWQSESPSKKAHDELGVFIGEGIILGVETALLAADLSKASAALMTKMKEAFSGVGAVDGKKGEESAQQSAGGIAQAVVGSLEGLDQTVAEIFTNMNTAVSAIMATMHATLIDGEEQYVEESTEIIDDFYDWTKKETKTLDKTVVDLFSGMRTKTVAIVKDLVVKSTAEFGKIKDAFRLAAKAAIDAAVKEFQDGAERIEAAIEGAIGGISSNLEDKFKEQGAKLGKALADGIVSAFKGTSGNNFITALASAIESAVNSAIKKGTASVSNGTPASQTPGGNPPPEDPVPTNPNAPRSLLRQQTAILDTLTDILAKGRSAQSPTLRTMLDTGDLLAPFRDAGLLGAGSLASTTGVQPLINGGTIINNISYNLYQTVTPEQAVRVERNFQLFEAKNRI